VSNRVVISLGTNIEPRLLYLKNAVQSILDSNITIEDFSSIYETDPIGYEEQDNFLNMILIVKTSLNPYKLLELTQRIEIELERERLVRWGPRTIDLDILLYNNEYENSDVLTIPHPRINERAFVLIPLYEIKSSLEDNQLSIINFENSLLRDEGVKIWKLKDGEGVLELFES
jgi:2-amino-4-hydroxy-6-hydroxymethyldihydropteridine diphosphokinase